MLCSHSGGPLRLCHRALAFWVPSDQCLQLFGLHFPFAEAGGQRREGMSCGVWRTRVQHVEQQAGEGEGVFARSHARSGLCVYPSYLLSTRENFSHFPLRERGSPRTRVPVHTAALQGPQPSPMETVLRAMRRRMAAGLSRAPSRAARAPACLGGMVIRLCPTPGNGCPAWLGSFALAHRVSS